MAAALSVIGSLISGLFGMGAAAKQSKADKQAAGTVQAAGEKAQGNTQTMLADSQATLNPYTSTGATAETSLGNAMQMGLNGQGPMASYTGSFQAPTAAQAEATRTGVSRLTLQRELSASITQLNALMGRPPSSPLAAAA